MPELPEVENIALGLRELIVDKTISRIQVLSPIVLRGPACEEWLPFINMLEGQRITAVTRRAKRLIVRFDQGQAWVIQLGMTGMFLYRSGSAPPLKHTHIVISFQESTELLFVDTRRFGRVWLFQRLEPDKLDASMDQAGMGRLGPDALSIQWPAFRKNLQRTSRNVKALLLDQSRIAGLGNIYVDESLFAAGIHPHRSASGMSEDVGRLLLQQIKRILRKAIRHGGTTFSDFRNAYGDMGRFRRRLYVYGRGGQPCKKCGTLIQKQVVAGRGTHFCPQCQV